MFNVFKKILSKQQITEEEQSKISEFVMMNWLSGDPVGVSIANVFNIYGGIPLDVKIKFIQGVLPRNIKYIKYPKKSSDKNEQLQYVSKYYNVSLQEARELLDLMDEEQLIQIMNVIKSQQSAKLRGRG